MTFLRRFSTKQLKSIKRFLTNCAKSKYAHDAYKLDYILGQIDRYFEFRMADFTSKTAALAVMQSIALYFCFVSYLTHFELCTWDVLVRRVFFVVPSIRILNRETMCFRHKKTVFVVEKSEVSDPACVTIKIPSIDIKIIE